MGFSLNPIELAARAVKSGSEAIGVDLTPFSNVQSSPGGGVPYIGKSNNNYSSNQPTPQRQSYDLLTPIQINGGNEDPGSTYTNTTSAADRAAKQQAAANAAAYQDQINALNQLLQAADSSRAQGEQSIDQSFNNNLSRLNQSQSNTLQSYNTKRQDTQADYGKNLQRINQGARNGFQNLQMLLGGTGSAGTILAPAAVSQAANQQRGTSSDAFARNNRDLDTAVTRAGEAYENNKNDLFNQKQEKLRELLGNVNSQKQNYISQRAAAENQLNIARGGGYTSGIGNAEIQNLLSQQGQLSKLFPTMDFAVKEVSAEPLSLAQYQAEAAKQAQGGGAEAGEDTTAAALAALLKQQEDQQLGGYAY